MPARAISLYWRVFAVNASLLALIAILLIASPVTISAPIELAQALLIVFGLVVTLAANAFLLRRAFKPLERLSGTDGHGRLVAAWPTPARGPR